MRIYNIFFLVLVFATCSTQFASDVYAPCLPAIAIDMHTSVSLAGISMSIYMLGVAISQLIYGPLSEGIGRKMPMIIGLSIMTIGSIICVLATNIETMIIGRLVQGCGAGACACLWRAVFRDSFSGEELSKYASYLVILIIFIAPAAPTVGGLLQETFGWYSNFIFMAIYSLLALLGVVFKFTETNKHIHISKLNPKHILSQYMILLKSPIFMGAASVTFLAYGAFFSWFVAGPILLIEKLGISPSKFGILTSLGAGLSYAIAGFLNGRLVTHLGMRFMIRLGLIIMLVAGVSMGAGHYIIGMSLWAIMAPIILFVFGSTFIWPNAFATAFTPFGHIAGYAGALYGFLQIGGAATLASFVAYLPSDNQLPLSLVMIIAVSAAWLIYELSTVPAS